MSGLEYSYQHSLSQLNSFFGKYSNHVRDGHASAAPKATVTDDALTSFQWDTPQDAIMLKVSWNPFAGYQGNGFVASAGGKAAKVFASSPAQSFKVLAAEDAPAVLLPPSPPCNLAAAESEAVDVAPLAPAPANGSVSMLTADELLGGSAPVLSCQSGAAAYRSECQRLAWARGRVLTWEAAALAGEQQQQQECVAAPAGPIALDDRWDYMFTCLEAAAKIGMRATYSMAVAGM